MTHSTPSAALETTAFAEIAALVAAARQRTLSAVNAALIDLYWQVGQAIGTRSAEEGWGTGTVEALAAYIERQHPGQRGFSPQNLWRMRQFYDTYRDHEKVANLLRQLPWSSHLHILAKCKRPEEREFYLRTAIQQRWPVREVARKIDGALFERAVLNPPRLSTALRELHPDAESLFRDACVVEFLDPPSAHSEADLHRALLQAKLHEFYLLTGADPALDDTAETEKA